MQVDQNPRVQLFAYLSYNDAPAAIHWLTDAFGFELVRSQPNEYGGIAHAEMRLGSAVIMLSSFDDAYEMPSLKEHSVGHGLYLLVDDVDTLYARAVAKGARSVLPPERTAWGTSRCRVLDPQGYEWSFGTYAPGE